MVILFGIYSLMTAALFMDLDAVDVAFTEAAVGSGVATVLMLATLALTKTRYEKHTDKFQWRAFIIVLLTGCALLYGIFANIDCSPLALARLIAEREYLP